MTHSSASELIEQRKELYEEFIAVTDGFLKDLSNNNFDQFELKLSDRKIILSKLKHLDHRIRTSSPDVDTSMIQLFSKMDEEIKLAESTLISNLSLKIQQFASEYQNRAKGLETLKGYRNSYFKENKETIGIV